jgi:hypothetical protein
VREVNTEAAALRGEAHCTSDSNTASKK